VPRRRLITVAPGGTGPRPPGTTTWPRGARFTDPEQMPVKEARDRSPKSPRWSAGRRASPVGDARRLARCLACPVSAGPADASRASRAGTLSNSCSFTTALGGASIKCPCRRRSIRGSSGWSPCRGCAERLAPMRALRRMAMPTSSSRSRNVGVSARGGLGLLPPPFTGEGWGGGMQTRILFYAPSLPLPRRRGRGCTERAARFASTATKEFSRRETRRCVGLFDK
jgi:hypothetical protein